MRPDTVETFSHLHIGDMVFHKKGQGRVTLAIRLTPEEYGAAGTVEVGVAFCSPKDQFTRAKGRELAKQRLDAGQDFYLKANRDPAVPLKSQTADMLAHLLGSTVSGFSVMGFTAKRCVVPKWAHYQDIWTNWDVRRWETGSSSNYADDGWERSEC